MDDHGQAQKKKDDDTMMSKWNQIKFESWFGINFLFLFFSILNSLWSLNPIQSDMSIM